MARTPAAFRQTDVTRAVRAWSRPVWVSRAWKSTSRGRSLSLPAVPRLKFLNWCRLMRGGNAVVVRANLKGVFPTYKTLRNGTRRTYWYHRATGRRLNGEPGSPEFIADLAAAEEPIRDRLAGTFNNLVRRYTLSTEFETALAASTKAEYRRMLTKAEAEFGDMPIGGA